MAKTTHYIHEIVSLTERESFLRAIPGFTNWTVTEISTLAALMQEIHIDDNSIIVSEGDIVDALYILANGSAEVSKQIDIEGKSGSTLIAVLNKGEVIGLNDTELFSPTGIRTATVTATTSCILLKIKLAEFNNFLKQHPQLVSNLRNSFKEVLKMQLIKEAAPFAQLTNERIAWMANLVKQRNYASDAIIFHQDEISDSCYIVYEGEVEIRLQAEDGSQKIAAVLKPGDLFGETALLSAGKRNATAKALIPTELLILDRDMLFELTAKDTSASAALMSMLVERNHPIRRENILFQKRTTADGHVIITLKDPVHNKYFQLNEESWVIWQQLNGKLTLPEITQQVYLQTGIKNSDLVLEIVRDLTEAGFVYLDVLNIPENAKDENKHDKAPWYQRLKFSYFLKKADKKLNFVYRYFGRLLVNPLSLALIFILAIAGMVILPFTMHTALGQLSKLAELPLRLYFALIVCMTALMMNSFIKTMVIKRYKYDVPHLVFSLRLFGPHMFADISDLSLSSRGIRCWVTLAGFFAQLAVAAGFILYFYYMDAHILFWLSALFIYLLSLRSLDPLLDQDGYQFMADLFDSPRLRDLAIHWLADINHYQLKNTKLALIYWGYCLFYLLIVLVFANWIMDLFLLYIPSHFKIKLFIFTLIIVAFILEIFMEYQDHKKILRNIGTG